MRMQSFEGRIKRVYKTVSGEWLCEIYSTENKEFNGLFDIKEEIIQEAKKLSRVPQPFAMITEKDGKIILVEKLE